jgi:hypothetical protein
MGLLDDAIREHLELKRLRGADPGVVAREEHDALGTITSAGNAADREAVDAEVAPGLGVLEDEAPRVADSSPSRTDITDSGLVGQETVEINMEAELASEGDSDPSPSLDRDASPVPHPASARPISDESLEWEVPEEVEERSDAVLDNNSGADSELDQGEPVEDVLEETPDFLRETPEQERLWFEQRPPRDFDFKE